MRKIVAAAFVSLDGVMQAPGGPEEDPTGGFAFGGWLVPHADETLGRFIDGMFAQPYDLLLGRRTYEIFAAHWPFMPEDDAIARSFNAVTKYVVTSSADAAFGWANTVALRGDGVAEVARLKAGEGPMLLTQGSGVLLHALLAAGLVDELRVVTFPVLLGKGKRLFDAGTRPGTLRLTASAVSGTGVVLATYERAGAVGTGSFALPDPSPAELNRRERWRRER
jgi:dihydrofolate reductase